MRRSFRLDLLVIFLMTSALVFGLLTWRKGGNEQMFQISVVIDESSDNRWVAFLEGLEEAADDNNVILNVINTEHFYAPVKQEEVIAKELNAADALIVQPYDSVMSASFLGESSKTAPLVFVEAGANLDAEYNGNCVFVGTDDDAMGRALAEELLNDYPHTKDLCVGILSGNQQQSNMKNRLAGVYDVLSQTDAQIAWELHDTQDLGKAIVYQQRLKRANIILALDDRSLEESVDYVQSVSFDIAIYGVGSSDANVFYLERGDISALIVPDEFQMGYEAVEKAVEKLDSPLRNIADVSYGFHRIRSEEIYEPENERLLFPLVQ